METRKFLTIGAEGQLGSEFTTAYMQNSQANHAEHCKLSNILIPVAMDTFEVNALRPYF